MCLVLSWKTGFLAMYNAALLSLKRLVATNCGTNGSLNKHCNYFTLLVAMAITGYLAYVEDRDNVDCFLLCQQISEKPS